MKKWLSEPLLHFIVLGALVFTWYAQVSPDRPGEDEIVVTAGQQRHLVTAFSRTWQRPPTSEELDHLVDDWIREEIAYREGLRMGLDTDDTIIRRRLRQKLELLAEDIVSLAQPTDADLQAFLEANQAEYQLEPTFTLQHIYFSTDRRGEAARQDAEQALALLAAGDARVDPAQLGDTLPMPRRFVEERRSVLAAQLGSVFAEDLQAVDFGRWDGPIRSGFGLHLVLVEAYTPGRALSLEEAREAVRRDWANRQRIDTIDQLYERLREQYAIRVEPLEAAAGASGQSGS